MEPRDFRLFHEFSRMDVHIDDDMFENIDTENVQRMTMREFRARIQNFNAYIKRREARDEHEDMLDELFDEETDFSREAASLYKFSEVYRVVSAKLRLQLAIDMGDKEVLKKVKEKQIIRF